MDTISLQMILSTEYERLDSMYKKGTWALWAGRPRVPGRIPPDGRYHTGGERLIDEGSRHRATVRPFDSDRRLGGMERVSPRIHLEGQGGIDAKGRPCSGREERVYGVPDPERDGKAGGVQGQAGISTEAAALPGPCPR